eukprot:CAMPEP_0181104282 /NCGR_PEP_ID=MMETSP1071-20121207/15338_1 /TAXON_ID=35127 /ORGANISM="Thalassiosira sp., Strain NH16" /LENGTH=169 /DNA_ID=CAMNT_0023187457 /DNA_START=535 /DNA_END=1040 /DNA_ORIENTATION=-
MSSSSSRSSSKSSSSKKSKSKKNRRGLLSGPAASMLNLSPVRELEEDYCDFDATAAAAAAANNNNNDHGGSTRGRRGEGAYVAASSSSDCGSGTGNYGGDNNLRGLDESDWDDDSAAVSDYDGQHQQQQQLASRSRQIYPQHVDHGITGIGGKPSSSYNGTRSSPRDRG